MKKTLQIAAVVIALAGTTALRAQSYNFNNGDLLLGFTASAGTGTGNDVLIDLGPVGQYNLSSAVGLNVNTYLQGIYGSSWETTGYVNWAAFSYNSTFHQLVASMDPSNLATFTQSTKDAVNAMGNAINSVYGDGSVGAATKTALTGTNGANNSYTYYAVEYAQSSVPSTGWAQFDQNPTPWLGGASSSIEVGTVGDGTDQLVNNYMGTNGATAANAVINLDSSGNITAVPEPSTYALFGIGTLAMLVIYRRRSNA